MYITITKKGVEMIDTDTDAEQLDQVLAPNRDEAKRHDRG